MEPLNREQRRHPEQLERLEHNESRTPGPIPEEQMRGDDRRPDDLSVRAKSSGHGKKTADKWNQ